MIQYQTFYRNFVLRKTAQFTQPPIPLVTRFELPNLAMVHYISPSATNPWPSEDMLFYQRNTKPLRITHHTTLVENRGNPRPIPGDVNAKIRVFRQKNPRFRASMDVETMKRDPRAIVTHNYGLLLTRFKYQRNLFTFHNRWHNVFATMFHTIGENTKTGYHQYIELQLPQQLPARSVLDRSVMGWNTRNMRVFNSYELIFLHHLWIWMGEDRHTGLIHKYIPDITNVKLILREGERFTILDLALFEEWRKPSRHEEAEYAARLEENPELPPIKEGNWAPSQLQKVFLRMLMAITEVRNKDLPESLDDDLTQGSTQVLDDQAAQNDAQPDEVPDQASGSPRVSSTQDGELTEAQAYAGYDEETDRLNLLAEIDKDLEALEITGQGDENAPLPEIPDETEEADSGIDDSPVQQAEVHASAHPVAVAHGQPEHHEAQVAHGQVQGHGDVPEHMQPHKAPKFFPTEHNEAFQALLARSADTGAITAAEYRRMQEASQRFNESPAPLGHEGTMAEFVKVPPEKLKIEESPAIPDQQTIVDKTMLKSSLLDWNKRYSREVMQRDISSMVSQLQSAGVMIDNYEMEEVEDITGSHYEYSIRVKPIEGAASTIPMKIPKVDDEGNFKINGVNYRMRMQRGDMPIRKIAPDQVALTSYYGKVFTERSQRRVNDWGKWIRNAIMAHGLNVSDTIVTNMIPGSAFEKEVYAPRTYSAIAMGFREFTLMVEGKPFKCNFDMSKMITLRMKPAMVVMGVHEETKTELLVGWDENLYIHEYKGEMRAAPSIETILGLDARKAPVEFAELKVFSKLVPVGVVLGYLLGWDAVLHMLNPPSMRIVPVGKRAGLVDDEWSINFDDKTYVFSRRDKLATMVLGGWRDFSETTSRFPSEEFNKKDVYFNLFEEKKLGVRYLRELDQLEQMFVDPITRDLLIEMGEPTVFTKLLVRASEMLTDDKHPDSQDTRYMRIKGYERFAGAVYSELVRAVRIHNGRPGKHRYGLEVNPYAVWIAIQQDPAKDQVSEINPIQNLKENEAVTYSGTGGRGSRSMVKSTRIYHRNDMGVISESTVDSSDVAINVFTSADPQFNSLRGTSKPYDPATGGATSLLSTSALVSPGSTKDDPKRVNFIGIQNRHVVACDGYTQAMVRTGYEQVIPHRVGDMFAVTAKKPGKVLSVKPDGIIVEFADGEKLGVVLGRRYGNAAGLTIPHTIATDMVVGQAFEVGEPIAYNTGFFERDMLNPKQIIWKSATLAKVALMESPDTLEDSSAISVKLTKKLITEQVKIKDIVVNFDQEIHRMVKEGEAVEPESMLCIIEDALSARNQFLDEETLDTLRVLGAQTPQAKIKGKIERIEVYYNGDLEDMSPSLRALAMFSDKKIAARNTSIGRKAYSGQVSDEFRIGTDPLLMDTACIRVYMSAKVSAGVGDKGVFGNQMKTVFGRVFNDNVRSESGVEIDAIFGAKSVADRIVTSPYLIGTTTTLLMVAAKRVIKAYRGG
ncbi:putative RNA polymerase beta subunit [Ralstonia phage RP31]|uniref:Putative RNA polymerase beta subunit n=1 Tax=Ralstonia phage RP31 TaxID=1923890 RepID=A0A1L7N1D6_9CAUD|nr:putative RNA polymerase beta subunit [Ralstonia phage RP31]